jgi:Interferon-induced transmembrane protein
MSDLQNNVPIFEHPACMGPPARCSILYLDNMASDSYDSARSCGPTDWPKFLTNKTGDPLMKRCPMCDRTYDDSQTFCVNDGATLVSDASGSSYDPMKTIVATPPPASQSAPLPPQPGYGSGDLPGGQAPASWSAPPPQQANQAWAAPPPPQVGMAPTAVPNYLVPAIISTLCCCLPLGVVSIIYATQVNSKLKVGDIQGAMDASAKAKMWFIIAMVSGVIINVIAILAQLAVR